jgi:hypothetical protein
MHTILIKIATILLNTKSFNFRNLLAHHQGALNCTILGSTAYIRPKEKKQEFYTIVCFRMMGHYAAKQVGVCVL